MQNISIPNSVTRIGNGAFSGCVSIASIIIPNSVTSIGRSAFNDCVSIKSITIPDGVTSIEQYAFSGCTSLASVTLPSSIEYIGDRAFSHCESLTHIIIPNSVIEIRFSVFDKSTGSISIFYEGKYEQYNALTCYENKKDIYCYSEIKPTSSGKYWHYVDGIPTIWQYLRQRQFSPKVIYYVQMAAHNWCHSECF